MAETVPPKTPRGDSPATELRQAASLLRERAGLVPPPPWYPAVHDVTTYDGLDVIASSGLTVRAQYVASMHPGVALAVADWLDETAKAAADALSRDFAECVHDEPCHCDHPPFFTCDRCYGCLGADCNCWDKPLAVATAVIGVTHGS